MRPCSFLIVCFVLSAVVLCLELHRSHISLQGHASPSPDDQKKGMCQTIKVSSKCALNIAVLAAWYPSEWFKQKSPEEKKMIMDNRKCYCQAQNYTLIVGSDLEVSHGYWAKLVHTKRVLTYSNMDWLFFSDTDFFITQFAQPLESFILNDDIHLVLPQEFEDRRSFSNFNFLIQNSKLGHQFIDTWLEESQATCNPDWPDQVAMWRAILRFLDPFTGYKTNCSKGPDYCCRKCDPWDIMHCFDEKMVEMGCGSKGPVQCGPISFTSAHSGLGLQTDGLQSSRFDAWEKIDSLILKSSFGIHCKQHQLLCKAYQQTHHMDENGACIVDFDEARQLATNPSPEKIDRSVRTEQDDANLPVTEMGG